MRKIKVSMFVALDGVVENPMWTFPYWEGDIEKFKYAELFSSDALLLGRTTYDGFAQAWPGRTDEQGYADRINSMRKYLVSTTAETGSWENTVVIKGNLAEEIRKIKEEDGQDILIFGSAALLKSLMDLDLVDEFWLEVYPLVQGSGQKMFADRETPFKLKLESTQQFSSGVLALKYVPDRS